MSVGKNLSNITTLAIVGGIGFLLYEFWKSSGAFITTAAADVQGVSDWFTADAVYNSDGTRIPLSNNAQTVLNSANILPIGVITTDGQGGIPTNLVQAYDASTGGTLYIDPATGNGVA